MAKDIWSDFEEVGSPAMRGGVGANDPWSDFESMETAKGPIDDATPDAAEENAFQRLYRERGEDVMKARQDPRLSPIGRGFAEAGETAEFGGKLIGEYLIEPALRGAGIAARETVGRIPVGGDKTVADVAGAGARAVGEAGKGIISSPIGQRGLQALRAGGQAWRDFEAENPNIAAVLAGSAKTGLFAAEAVPLARGGAAATQAAARGAAKVVEATPVTGTAIKSARSMVEPFTPSGAERRARGRLGELVEAPEQAAEAMRRPSPLTPMQRTGETDLMRLEATIAGRSPVTERARARQIEEARGELTEQLAPEGDVGRARQYIEGRAERITGRLEDRKNQALLSAQQRLDELAPAQREAQASSVIREELESALSQARSRERELWGAIPGTSMNATGAVNKYKEVTGSLSRAQAGDVPDVARRLLDPTSPERYTGIVAAKELQGLRSKLLEDARIARSEGKYNRARVADEIADGILEDLGAQSGKVAGPAGQALREALDYSRQLNETFSRGTVGKILRPDRAGAERIAPEETLRRTIGTGKVKGGVAIKQLLQAADTPEAKKAITDYVLEDFQRQAVKDNIVDPVKALKFVDENIDIMDEFPEIRTNVQNAINAQISAARAEGRLQAVTKSLTRQQDGATSRLLDAPVGEEIRDLFKRDAKDAQMAARDLMKIVRRDPDAVAGVQNAAVEFFVTRARGNIDDSGNVIISGSKMLKDLQDAKYRRAVDEILGADGLERLETIASDLRKLEKAAKAEGFDSIIDDTPNKILNAVFTTMGARAGAKLGAGTSGASLKTASFMSGEAQNFLRSLTGDGAEKLLIQATTDPDLFDALVKSNLSTKAGRERASKKLNLWLAGPGAVAFADYEGGEAPPEARDRARNLLRQQGIQPEQ